MAVRDEDSNIAQFGDRLLSFAGQHASLIAPLIGAVIFAVRCSVVSRGDAQYGSHADR